MNVAIMKAALSDRTLIENLLQLYVYDFTEYTDASIGENGVYQIMPDFESYWSDESSQQAYVIKANGEIAGFMMTKEKDETQSDHVLSHFFILRKFRRMGVGRKAAACLLKGSDRAWELCQLEGNIPAQKFWDQIIDEVSYGEVKIKRENGRRYQNFICK
ncbi:GNAT family N-acetyltransferase [Paenibacillus gallinarum]|uniref:GNAT family N-acetyltransferase n=1 Tax=Paenibacillus gallinarum TaxID=2762232 RepID=A0ABR8T0C0_9BACL|nr:GNAT family N-acetyltransferase [Paenibacillus gallinarum]MBD7969205.1 GNAT family N-acetyltransferase [Paenibacillus gallinarum]